MFYLFCFKSKAQYNFDFTFEKTAEQCNKGSALITLTRPGFYDSIAVNWSAGRSALFNTTDLEAGEYSVQIYLRLGDTTRRFIDTTLVFTIEKELCPLIVPKYFSPNDDNYSDVFDIANIKYHPEFELSIYNRQGSRVHHQKNEFEPWDGRWMGAPLPDGTYYYVIYYDKNKKSQVLTGDVTILR